MHKILQTNNFRKQGSALVAVLVILAVAILIITITMQNVLIDTDMSFNLKKSNEVRNNSISAIEEAALRLMRDPDYAGSTLNLVNGNVIITVNTISPSQKEISVISKIHNNRYICNMEAIANFDDNGNLSITDIVEVVN